MRSTSAQGVYIIHYSLVQYDLPSAVTFNINIYYYKYSTDLCFYMVEKSSIFLGCYVLLHEYSGLNVIGLHMLIDLNT